VQGDAGGERRDAVRYAARTVALERESIERRDFPLARRGYDPAAVESHLRALAAEAQELRQRVEGATEPALGPAAATQVRGILDAAQATAAQIESEARREAQRIREEAAQDAERARAHVETLARATAALHERVATLDGELSALALSLRAGDGEPLAAPAAPPAPVPASPAQVSLPPAPPPRAATSAPPSPTSVPPASTSAPPAPPPLASAPAPPAPPLPFAPPATTPAQPASQVEDLDGARLVVLNMALGGESREQADRYLADSFQLADREKLLDEIYAAIEG
jgi:hypothetical protein